MKAVVDTNVLVAGLLGSKKGGPSPPEEVVDDILSGVLTVLYDARILDEYREVLARPKFKFDAEDVESLLQFIVSNGVAVADAHFSGTLPDPDDQPFADVAFTGGADVLITGNGDDFPVGAAIRVITPRQWVELKGSG